MQENIDFDQLKELAREHRFRELRALLVEMNEVDIAEFLESLEDRELLVLVFRLLPKSMAADIFTYLEDSDIQEQLINDLTDTELRAVIADLYLDDAVDIIEDMPANVVSRMLRNTDSATRSQINALLSYPKDSAGSIMTPEFVTLHRDATVEQSFARIRKIGIDRETVYTCYVTENRVLIGVVTVRRMLLSSYETRIEDIMETNVVSVHTHDDKEDVAQVFSKYDLPAVPVVDGEDRLVGIVTFDDAMDVMEEETTEDIELMHGMTPSEKPYMRSTPLDLFKNRIPWLMLLMVSATFTGMIITSFEDALAAQVALTSYIPMLMGTGGNSGSQTSVTVIRALSLGEVKFRDLGTVLWKELRTAVICGVTLAAACFVKIWLVDRTFLGNENITVMVDLVVCVALCVTVIMAKAVGCLLPMAAKALKLDPAVMAGPFISTIVDALSLLAYFLFAQSILGL